MRCVCAPLANCHNSSDCASFCPDTQVGELSPPPCRKPRKKKYMLITGINFKDKDLRVCASGGIPLVGILHGSLPCQCPDGVYQVEQNDPNDVDDPQHYHRVEATCVNGHMPNVGTATDANGCDADSYYGRQVMPIPPLRTTIEYSGPPGIKPLWLLGLRW